jgi:CRISPR-associated protein Csb2
VPLSILVRLRRGRYDAATERPGLPEWPPHPARVFCALVASAVDAADWDALRWLESAGPPEVWASPPAKVRRSVTAGWVVTNRVERKGGSQRWPARTNGLRSRASVLPADGQFAVVWPDADPPARMLQRLRGLARRAPYLGRSTCPADLTVAPLLAERHQGWAVFAPTTPGRPGAAVLRVPYRGYVDQLQDAYADGRRAWEVARGIPYAAAQPEAGRTAWASPFEHLVVFGWTAPTVPPSGDRLLLLTGTLRQAVVDRVPDPVPPQVCGHGADGRQHLAFLALVDVGHDHADGHALGVALALPGELEDPARALLVEHLIDEPLRQLTTSRTRPLGVEYRPDRTRPYGLLPERWTAAPAGARRWVTATPLMLDRFPKPGADPAEAVAQALVTAGYPAPVRVEVSSAALVAGAVHRPQPGTIPPGRPRRPLLHARVEFAQPILGLVLAGSLRYLGLGLFVPEREGQ